MHSMDKYTYETHYLAYDPTRYIRGKNVLYPELIKSEGEVIVTQSEPSKPIESFLQAEKEKQIVETPQIITPQEIVSTEQISKPEILKPSLSEFQPLEGYQHEPFKIEDEEEDLEVLEEDAENEIYRKIESIPHEVPNEILQQVREISKETPIITEKDQNIINLPTSNLTQEGVSLSTDKETIQSGSNATNIHISTEPIPQMPIPVEKIIKTTEDTEKLENLNVNPVDAKDLPKIKIDMSQVKEFAENYPNTNRTSNLQNLQ